MLQEDKMRTLTVKEIAKYYREFPFMETVLDREAAQDPKHFRLKVQVSVADAKSLFIIPRYCLHPNWIGNDDGKYIGHVHPVAYAFNSKNERINSLVWNCDYRDHFLKEVIKGKDIRTVVLVRIYDWWHEIEDWFKKGHDTYVGAYSHHEWQIFIFKEPKQGFGQLIVESDLTKNVPINDLLSISMAGCRKQNEATVAIKALEALVDKFEKSIGFSLWKRVSECKHSGMSGIFGRTELRTFVTAGRIMLSFWSGKDQITFVGVESDYTRTGLQSMNCTVDMAKFIVQQVIDNWEASKLQSDDNTSIL
jgi:hypothetical protein